MKDNKAVRGIKSVKLSLAFHNGWTFINNRGK